MPRPQKPYQTTWGEVIPGLSKAPNDGRWRIVETGQKFTEPDEQRAIAKFRSFQNKNAKINLELPWQKGHDPTLNATGFSVTLDNETEQVTESAATYPIDEAAIWAWVKTKLIDDPIAASLKLGIPEIANLKQIKIRQEIKLEDLLNNYMGKNISKKTRSPEAGKAVFIKFLKQTGFQKLSDITIPGLVSFRNFVDNDSGIGPATKRFWYRKIKTILRQNMRYGIDGEQIREALDKLSVLYTDDPMPQVNPQPISRDDFHKLLNAANPFWKAIILMSLNCCLHLGETVTMRWSELKLDGAEKVYATIRTKTQKHKIPRAAVLWEETIKALAQVNHPKDAEYVFTTKYGTRYNRAAAGNLFMKIRTRAKVSNSVKFDSIRDGAYTAATRAIDGEKLARLLAGHSSGMADHYVLRNPEIVKPACDAVYSHYFG